MTTTATAAAAAAAATATATATATAAPFHLTDMIEAKALETRIILPVVLYGCETWTLTLREEQRLRVFENKVLSKIFGAKRDEVTGEWRKLHNAELHALYSSPDIIRNIKSRRLRWAGHVARMGESRNAYRVLVGRPEGKRLLGRPRRMWADNIKMDLREVGYDGRDWINLAQDRDQWRAYARAAMNLRPLRHIVLKVWKQRWEPQRLIQVSVRFQSLIAVIKCVTGHFARREPIAAVPRALRSTTPGGAGDHKDKLRNTLAML
ncbi:hypothetical protein ANN_14872 [Periplaneta americana]|uniref:Endonuclease-reverse transcriptase n=1 Tax=Periplaneta americana TaxID=6978 RepID=A0ABQ8SYS1_PERAM|nr:hypothetical protein ANN_14872 [Periplaneta americana]